MKKSILILLTLISPVALAAIYETTDAEGHKSYSDKPPLNQSDAKTKEVAPMTENTWETNPSQTSDDQFYRGLKARQEQEQKAQKEMADQQEAEQQRQAKAEADAKKALEDAKEVKAGDFYKNPNGEGLRYTQEYRDRVKNAEENLKKAQQSDTDE